MSTRLFRAVLLALPLAGCEGTVNNDVAGGFPLAVTLRVSLATGASEAEGGSTRVSLSQNGRIVAFASFATNLAPGIATGAGDVYVRDLDSGVTEIVSIDPSGQGGNALSTNPAISADGRYVAFESDATNLVAGTDGNGATDIFVRDRQTGATERVSRNTIVALGNGPSRNPSISANGRWVAFESEANNLDNVVDGNDASDVYVHDRQTGNIERISRTPFNTPVDGGSYSAAISGDGRFVAYSSDATDLVTNDTNGFRDIFVTDRVGFGVERVSVDAGQIDADGASRRPAISFDGRYVAFESDATDLTTLADNNNASDVYVRDRLANATQLASRNSLGALGAGASSFPSISGSGRWVAFVSESPNLVDGDTNTIADVFVRDALEGVTFRASVRTFGVQPADSAPAGTPSISGDAKVLAFLSASQDMVDGDTNGAADVFVRAPLH